MIWCDQKKEKQLPFQVVYSGIAALKQFWISQNNKCNVENVRDNVKHNLQCCIVTVP